MLPKNRQHRFRRLRHQLRLCRSTIFALNVESWYRMTVASNKKAWGEAKPVRHWIQVSGRVSLSNARMICITRAMGADIRDLEHLQTKLQVANQGRMGVLQTRRKYKTNGVWTGSTGSAGLLRLLLALPMHVHNPH